MHAGFVALDLMSHFAIPWLVFAGRGLFFRKMPRSEKIMKGWKTWVAAAGLAGLGVFLMLKGKDDVGMICICNGLGLVGIGSKIEKAAAGK